jgi:Cu+-exporting ATPase
MERINWKVEGMSCTNCALTVDKFLQGKGMHDVKVNFMSGDVSFDMASELHTGSRLPRDHGR